MRIAIIGGTGVYDPRILTDLGSVKVNTVFGDVEVKVGKYGSEEVAFLQRHGSGHSVPPHRINYRANIAALKILGVERIIATSAVGSVNPDMHPGSLVILDQFIDFSKSRDYTFYDGGDWGVVHIDYTEPYCGEIRNTLIDRARELGIPVHPKGCYACFEGPRFETPAEIKMTRIVGGDLVGMTNVPEVVLAREAEICYAVVAMVTNFAAGMSNTQLTHGEVLDVMKANSENLKSLAMKAIETMPHGRGCKCGKALDDHVSMGGVRPDFRKGGS